MMKRLLSEGSLLDRRTTGRESSDARGWWLRKLQPAEILAWCALAALLLSAAGWRYYSPAQFDERLTKVERRVDTLASEQKFIIYLQCVQMRRSDPLAVPPGCGAYTDSRRFP